MRFFFGALGVRGKAVANNYESNQLVYRLDRGTHLGLHNAIFTLSATQSLKVLRIWRVYALRVAYLSPWAERKDQPSCAVRQEHAF